MNAGEPDPGSAREKSPYAGEDMDVRVRHGQIWREFDEPREILRSIPNWVLHLYTILTFWGIWYLLYHSGGFRWDQYVENPTHESRLEQVANDEEESPRTGDR